MSETSPSTSPDTGCGGLVRRRAPRRWSGTRAARVVPALLALVLAGAPMPPVASAATSIPVVGGVGSSTPDVGPAARSSFIAAWSWPLVPEPRVLRHFERPPQDWKPGHRGVDLSTRGLPAQVRSPADGVVAFAGTVVDRGVLTIDHGDGRISSFEPVTTTLVEGRAVGTGDVVATVAVIHPATASGGTVRGHCGGLCLHWGVRVEGEYVDPLAFVTDRRPSVLLPLVG